MTVIGQQLQSQSTSGPVTAIVGRIVMGTAGAGNPVTLPPAELDAIVGVSSPLDSVITNPVVVNYGAGSGAINGIGLNGVTTFSLYAGQSVILQCDNEGNWNIIAGGINTLTNDLTSTGVATFSGTVAGGDAAFSTVASTEIQTNLLSDDTEYNLPIISSDEYGHVTFGHGVGNGSNVVVIGPGSDRDNNEQYFQTFGESSVVVGSGNHTGIQSVLHQCPKAPFFVGITGISLGSALSWSTSDSSKQIPWSIVIDWNSNPPNDTQFTVIGWLGGYAPSSDLTIYFYWHCITGSVG